MTLETLELSAQPRVVHPGSAVLRPTSSRHVGAPGGHVLVLGSAPLTVLSAPGLAEGVV